MAGGASRRDEEVTDDLKSLGELMAEAAATQPDPYTGVKPIPSGVGPGLRTYASPAEAAGTSGFRRAFERNVVVGPLIISICRCPQCGQVFPYFRDLLDEGWEAGAMLDDDPDPPCWRCEVAVGVPLSPHEAAAMAEFRWRLDRFLKANEGPSGASTSDRRATLVAMSNAAQIHGPALLGALERRYGNQQDAGVAAILNGVEGVTSDTG